MRSRRRLLVAGIALAVAALAIGIAVATAPAGPKPPARAQPTPATYAVAGSTSPFAGLNPTAAPAGGTTKPAAGGTTKPTAVGTTTAPGRNPTTSAPASGTTSPGTPPAQSAQSTQSTQTTPSTPTAGQQLGASVNILFNSQNAFSSGQIGAQLQALQAAGARIARSDALWERTEPTPPVGGVHHYQWGFDDSVAGALAAHGLRWLPIVDYTAGWARPPGADGHPPPSSASDYSAFAAALAARYGPGGTFWRAHPNLPATPVDTYEIWNEPDNPTFWSPLPDPARYGELYARARAAIKAVDPGARVLIGGLTHPEAFLPAVIADTPQLRGEVDGVAIHPYAGSPGAVLSRVREARKVLDDVGLTNVPLYITEFGWTTQPSHALNWAPSSQRAGDVSRTFAELGHTNCNVAAVVLYTWVTLQQNPADREDWFGISPRGGGGDADTAAFASGLQNAAAPGPQLPTCTGV